MNTTSLHTCSEPSRKAAKAQRTWTPILAAAVVFGGTLTMGRTAQAQEIQLTGPLAGAPAVKRLRIYRKGRFEVAPGMTFTLLDEYRRTMLPGARLQYNVTDWLGLGVWGAFGAISTTTDLTDQIEKTAPQNSRTALNLSNKFSDQTAKIKWVAAPQVQAVPFRGKIAIFQKIFVDTDAYFHAGLAFVGLEERADCGSATNSCVGAFKMATRTSIAPTFGLGLNFYLPFSHGLSALNLEYRALPFSWNRGGFDSRGSGTNAKFADQKVDSQDQTFKFNQMISVNIGFSFPKLQSEDAEEKSETHGEKHSSSGEATGSASVSAGK